MEQALGLCPDLHKGLEEDKGDVTWFPSSSLLGELSTEAGKRNRIKYRKHSKRKQTMFTEKQLAYLNFLKNKNPYPILGLQREMASKMELHLTVLQDWFKNCRVKSKKAKDEDFPSEQRKVLQPFAEVMVKIVCADPLIPSFQLSIWPALKSLTDHSLGHKIVHFGCCQDPNIYYLYPIVES
nr:PREDICTED: LOW QUALITY PROTEIN: divergent paired-related homeobox [Bos mutus]